MNTRGFTLIELLITITIVAIMLALAVPSYSYITSTKRINSELDALVVDIQYARSEALRQGAQVEICASSDGATCSNNPAWQTGWIVHCVDANCSSAASKAVLKVKQPFTGPETLNETSNATTALTFGSMGYPVLPSNAGLIFTMKANSDQSLTHCLLISLVGQLSQKSYTPGVCT